MGDSATSNDVARLAGVSRATVSRTLNGSDRVSEEIRLRVLAAAEKLGYEPDAAAQSLGRTSRSIALGSFGDDSWALSQLARPKHYFYLSVLRHIETGVTAAGYDLLLPSPPSTTGSRSFIRRLRSRRVAGALMIAFPPSDPRIHALIETDLPTVFIDTVGQGPHATYVTSDNVTGGAELTAHLIGLGHRRIARVAADVPGLAGGDRLAGIRKALAAAGLPDDPALHRGTDWSTESAYLATRDLLEHTRDFTAVIADSDMMAFGVVRALREAGLRVPGDVSVAGFDDINLCEYVDPPLTTVRQDPAAMGEAAVRALLGLIGSGTELEPVVLPTELLVRGSTAAPSRT